MFTVLVAANVWDIVGPFCLNGDCFGVMSYTMSQRGGTCRLQVSLPNLHRFALPVFNGPYPTFTSGVGPLVPSTGSSWPVDKAFL